jgi:hypothetical protein
VPLPPKREGHFFKFPQPVRLHPNITMTEREFSL